MQPGLSHLILSQLRPAEEYAEEYIEANVHRAVMLEELAAATGVGARNLFRIFRQTRCYTPMAFAKLIRLKRARRC
jgi:transcriptional regulator GlxA family with amidase domain